MAVLAIIPARGGSKRIAGKNTRPLAGRPLVAHTIAHALAASSVDEVVVSTDCDAIAAIATAMGAAVCRRPESLAGDTATSESALLHVLDTRRAQGWDDPELVAFLQCTSPIRAPDDIDRAIAQLRRDELDSLLSACVNTRFCWGLDAAGQPMSLNYDFRHRRREQDLAPQYQENGSIYLFRPWLLRQSGNRLGGRMGVYVMDYWASFQVDEPEDLELIAWIMSRPHHRQPPPTEG